MKKIIYLIVVVLFISCSEQEECTAPPCDETCGKILSVDYPSGNFTSTYWEVELVCSGEVFTHENAGTNRPAIGTIICKDNWNRQ